MATKLIQLAQRLQDLYEQNYAPNDRFLNVDDFKFQVALTYSELLNSMYQMERAKNKQLEGWSNIEIPASWMIREPLIISCEEGSNRFVAKTTHPVYSFDWDNAANALQDVFSRGKHKCSYRKISLSERKFRDIIPPSGVVFYFLNTSHEIEFLGAKDKAEIDGQYVPAVAEEDEDCLLSDSVCGMIQDKILARMFQAKNGNFIQKTDNQNPNVVPAQQADPALGKI